MSKKVFCHGCKYFFITHRIKRPWGCKKFGFKSAKIPYQEVMSTSGMKCAYYIKRSINKTSESRRRSK